MNKNSRPSYSSIPTGIIRSKNTSILIKKSVYLLCIFIMLFMTLYFINYIRGSLPEGARMYEPFVDPNNKPRYAVCMWGQLRGVKTTVDSFYNNLINPLGADLFICCQKTDTGIDQNIDLFQQNIAHKELYTAPIPNDVFPNLVNLTDKDNYIKPFCLQIYYNFYKLNELYGDVLQTNYDYIILTRSDFLHLFEYPHVAELSNNMRDMVWSYSGHNWDGVNMNLFCVPSSMIRQFLVSNYNYLNDTQNTTKLNNVDLNIEKFFKLVMAENQWKRGEIENNSFITADKNNEMTTWAKIEYSEKYKVLYKYIDQLNSAYESYDKWTNGYKWSHVKNDMDRIVLTL